ncbi:hypothetical protein Tco_0156020 [Tanacetum coccineum]
MIKWIMVCVTSASYSACVNGDIQGWFQGKHGLRQGDLVSPYLFTLNKEVSNYLITAPKGHPNSVAVIMDVLEEFKNVSIRYPSVPLISSRLLYRDCKVLVEKLEVWIIDWQNKFLSLVGWLQLVRLVLSFMHIYWASVFILPARIVHGLEQLMQGFLWFQIDIKIGKAKVAWDSIFKPKWESGLVPVIHDDIDNVLVWRDLGGAFRSFSVACAWDSIILRADVVDWFHVIWFPHCLESCAYPIRNECYSPCGYCLLLPPITYGMNLVTFKFKKVSPHACVLLDKWKIPSSSMVQYGSSM